jgi:hypothetical protein
LCRRELFGHIDCSVRYSTRNSNKREGSKVGYSIRSFAFCLDTDTQDTNRFSHIKVSKSTALPIALFTTVHGTRLQAAMQTAPVCAMFSCHILCRISRAATWLSNRFLGGVTNISKGAKGDIRSQPSQTLVYEGRNATFPRSS